jgi:hypothetical protein
MLGNWLVKSEYGRSNGLQRTGKANQYYGEKQGPDNPVGNLCSKKGSYSKTVKRKINKQNFHRGQRHSNKSLFIRHERKRNRSPIPGHRLFTGYKRNRYRVPLIRPWVVKCSS